MLQLKQLKLGEKFTIVQHSDIRQVYTRGRYFKDLGYACISENSNTPIYLEGSQNVERK